MSELFYCNNCKNYTLDKICPRCNNKSIMKKPAKFSPQDHYGRYRRELKRKLKKK
jgi:H/ACA ribonucleoprotein complex subunit 3